MPLGLILVLALQQQATSPVSPTTPPSADTAGYWQQRADYRITARLDEARSVVRASATLTYVNNSPDTLREIYLHQHLNAFRPGSKWSEVDAREGRVRFQNLEEPNFGYERFTATPTVDGVSVSPEYPGAPDSTVVRLALPRALAPRDSAMLTFEWEARPSIPPRRQGRRGRSFDFAQWYPRVAVYNRAGWRPNALVPAGEFYGEFGNFDVTLIVPEDQVIGASGVPVEGDPGWERALKLGRVHPTSTAYANVVPSADSAWEPGMKRVRFVARRVHHFAWSTSPDYIYEGGVYVRPPLAQRPHFTIHDTVALHILYRPGDEAQWGNGQALGRTVLGMRWLEHVFGPYAWPQLTNLHRIEGGGTEFPMMMMNGSASQGLIIHEGAHQFAHGILANNEWQSAWLDEGLASYVTSWSTGNTLHDLANHPPSGPRPKLDGYRGKAHLPVGHEATQIEQYELDLLGRAEPMGQSANDFNEFPIYNEMVYTRAELMYGALRDVMGDSAFHEFLREYYRRWALKHVDETAMRSAAERVHGEDLRWFFDQWIHRTGLIDYAISGSETRQVDGEWLTRVRVEKRGDFWHPVPVGVRTSAGWTTARVRPLEVEQWLEFRTAERPSEIMIDPRRTTEDWNGRNDHGFRPSLRLGREPGVMHRFGWPYLEQYDRDRTVSTWFPLVWYSEPGGLTIGLRQNANYQGWTSKEQTDAAVPFRGVVDPEDDDSALDGLRDIQAMLRFENPQPFGARRPWIGVTSMLASLDGIGMLQAAKTWNSSRYLRAAGPRVSTTLSLIASTVHDTSFAPAARWEDRELVEVGLGHRRTLTTSGRGYGRVHLGGGYASALPDGGGGAGLYPRIELELGDVRPYAGGRAEFRARVFGGYANDAPRQRLFREGARDPVETFANHLTRPRNGVLSHPDAHYRRIGGFGMRGSGGRYLAESGGSLVLEQAMRLASRSGSSGTQALWASAFAGTFVPFSHDNVGTVLEGGLSLALKGRFYDRDFGIRFDVPLYYLRGNLDEPAPPNEDPFLETAKARWGFTFGDLW